MFASLVSGTIMDLYYVKFNCMMSITVNINIILVRTGTWLRSCLTVVRLPAASRPFCSINCASCNRAFVRRKSRRRVCSTSVDTSRTVNVIHQHQRIPVSLIERGLQYYEQSCISLTPLASFNCTGMAFRGGYFFVAVAAAAAALCSTIHYGTLELTDITFMQLICFTVMAVNIILSKS